ncbi:hypothetical protein [Bradyrhizobium pachyrhizi]|uniref:hypothetical protein n=1 Tax=Bradyrhizobium pachyrhizi TaxID=280333 RepID=UPI0012E3F1C6|nr:hypothetical protein [Bradyrhizobium pachyrhizi]
MQIKLLDASSDHAEEEPKTYSVYLGRERLGRFVRIGRNEFDALDRDDQPLGTFPKQKEAVRAIRAAVDRRR